MKTILAIVLCLVVAGQTYAGGGGGGAAAGAAMMIMNNAAVMSQQHMNNMMSHEVIRQNTAIRQNEDTDYPGHCEDSPPCGKSRKVLSVATPDMVSTTQTPANVGLGKNGNPYLFTATSSFVMPREHGKVSYPAHKEVETPAILYNDLPPGEYIPPPYEYQIWENGWWIQKYREFVGWVKE